MNKSILTRLTRTTSVQASSSAATFSVGLAGVGQAFKRAMVSQCHPKMLFAILLPFLIILIGAFVLLGFGWAPLTAWLHTQAAHWDFMNDLDDWLVTIGLFSLKVYLVPMLAVAILLPASGILGLMVAAVFVMPIVLRHVSGREYALLKQQGKYATLVSVWNAAWVSMAFALGWVLTLPLWLVPPMALLLSVFWWAFAFSRMMRVDAIVEHASPQERLLLLRRHNTGFWMIGLICSLLNLLPPAWVFLPVFSALVFVHYGLEALQQLRQEKIIDVKLSDPT